MNSRRRFRFGYLNSAHRGLLCFGLLLFSTVMMIGVGALGVILGGVHLGIPLFVRADSCVQNGLLFPCVADRYGVGGAVLGVGLLSIGGGILTLALP